MPNYDHCLRPIFTERIIQLLQHGKSLNLIGTEATGMSRVVGYGVSSFDELL